MNAQYSLPGYDHPIIRWLLGEGRRITESMSFLSAFAEQLRGSGIEVDRVSIGVPILHPQVYAFSGIWEPGKGALERRNIADASSLSRLARSPVKTLYEGGGPVRCDLTAAATEGEYGIYADLRREGFIDYFAIGVPFSDGSSKALILATKRPGGFTADEIAVFCAMAPMVAINLEIQALRRTAQTLLRTLLLSEAFVSAAGVAVEPMGRFPLKGMAAPQTVSAPLE